MFAAWYDDYLNKLPKGLPTVPKDVYQMPEGPTVKPIGDIVDKPSPVSVDGKAIPWSWILGGAAVLWLFRRR